MVRFADILVYLDDVQFTRRDWRNRNLIAGECGPKWMTVPLKNTGNYKSLIHEMAVSDPDWWKSNLSFLENTYRGEKHFRELKLQIRSVFESLEGIKSLSEINRKVNDWIFSTLEIATSIRDSREIPSHLKRSERLIEICEFVRANEYITGPAAQAYLDEELFKENSLLVNWIDYSALPPLETTSASAPELSILHLLATMERAEVIRLTTFRPRGCGSRSA